LLQRSLTALVAIPVLIGAIWLGAPWLTILAALAGVVAICELYRMTPTSVGPLPVVLGGAWVLALIFGGQVASGRDNFLIISAGISAVGAFAAILWSIAFYKGKDFFAGLLYLALGPLYVGFLLAHGLILRDMTGPDTEVRVELGLAWLLFAVLVTFATDTGAFLVGRSIGSRPLAPVLSPNKTWEGSVGGFAAAVGAALLLGVVIDLQIAVWQQAVAGAVLGVVTQWGDLLESKLKRVADVKDAGSIIPGHGGLLDRLDSLLFALPAVYYLLTTVFVP
tara:strand:+ start:3683 stop:4519 length:837 start_codon:yes stop_codon:yes gene_type:complete